VCSTGNRKAAVLPLPVWLDTIRSVNLAPLPLSDRSCIAIGMRLFLTTVGWVNPGPHSLQQFGRQAHFLETVRLVSTTSAS
jgi:hypothetical protein